MSNQVENEKVEQSSTQKIDPKFNNYTLIELLHLTYLIRDSLEYCHPNINVSEENFEKRRQMAKNMLAEGNFVQKWLANHPKEDVQKLYPQLCNYFNSIYEEENYVIHSTRKVDVDKMVDFIEETVKNYQICEDILNAFYLEYKKTDGIVDLSVEKCIKASKDYYRVIANWLFFNEVLKNDGEYKKALKASEGKPSYEVNYNLNILKRLIAGYNFNKQRYSGDKVDVKQMIDDSMIAFQTLDGTYFKQKEENEKVTLNNEEKAKISKELVEKAAGECVNAIRLYEPIWRDTYQEVVKYMQANPLQQKVEA